MNHYDDAPPPSDADMLTELTDDNVTSLVGRKPRIGKMTKAEKQATRFSPDAYARHPKLNHYDYADAFVAMFGNDMRFLRDAGDWMTWNGKHWQTRDQVGVDALYQIFSRRMVQQAKDMPAPEPDEEEVLKAANIAHLEERQGAWHLRETLVWARVQPNIALPSDMLDQRTLLLSVNNCTIDLHTGEALPFERTDYATHISPVTYDPQATCPVWEEFLDFCFQGSDEMIDFMQRVAGYTLTGETKEQKLFFLYGDGGRGKGTFVETLAAVLGKHAHSAPTSFIEQESTPSHPTTLAATMGKRMVYVSETRKGKLMDTVRVKQFTGEDTVTARRMREDEFSFRPIAKLFITGNYKPTISDVDEGIWRRMVLIGFEREIPAERKDIHLRDKLMAELPGILAWCVRGAQKWREQGLSVPGSVVEATKAYRAEQDHFSNFCDECLVFQPNARMRASRLNELIKKWFTENNSIPPGRTQIGERMSKRGGLYSKATLRFGPDETAKGWLHVRERMQMDDESL